MNFRGNVGRNQRTLIISGCLEEKETVLEGYFLLPEGRHLDPTAEDYRLTLDDGRSFFIRILRVEYSGARGRVYFKSNGPF